MTEQDARIKLEELENAINQDKLVFEKISADIKSSTKLLEVMNGKIVDAENSFKKQTELLAQFKEDRDIEMKSKSDEVSTITTKLSGIKAEMENLTKQRDEILSGIKNVKLEWDILSSKQKSDLEAFKQELAMLEEQKNSLISEKEKILKEKDNCEATWKGLCVDNDKLVDEIAANNNKVVLLETQITNLKRDIEDLESESSLKSEEIKKLEEEIVEKSKEKEEVEAEIAKENKELDSVKAKVARINAKSDFLDKREEFLEDQHSRLGLPYKRFE